MNPNPITPTSPLDQLIPPEVQGYGLAEAIYRIAQLPEVLTMLEIGSSDGQGSTMAFARGVFDSNVAREALPTLFCLEMSKARFAVLQRRYRPFSFVKCYNLASSWLGGIATDKEMTEFYNTTETAVNGFPIETVLGWLRTDRQYAETGFAVHGIQLIKDSNAIDTFDMALIDGSEFTGRADFAAVYGAKWILLDDVNGFKNWGNYHQLAADPAYVLDSEDWSPRARNGFAVFRKR